MQVNFGPLFTASRVVTATYRIVSTVFLFGFLIRRVREGRKITRTSRRIRDMH